VPASLPPTVQAVLRSPGQPLEPGLRADMEGRFGHDFSRVRIHADAAAAASTRALHAYAYTVGHDIVLDDLRSGRDGPPHPSLGHELAHVVQQDRATGYSGALLGTPADPAEIQADRAAASVDDGGTVHLGAPAVPAFIQRQERRGRDGGEDAHIVSMIEALAGDADRTPTQILLARAESLQAALERAVRPDGRAAVARALLDLYALLAVRAESAPRDRDGALLRPDIFTASMAPWRADRPRSLAGVPPFTPHNVEAWQQIVTSNGGSAPVGGASLRRAGQSRVPSRGLAPLAGVAAPDVETPAPTWSMSVDASFSEQPETALESIDDQTEYLRPEIGAGLARLSAATVNQATLAVRAWIDRVSAREAGRGQTQVSQRMAHGGSLRSAAREIWYVAERLYVIDRSGHLAPGNPVYQVSAVSMRPGIYFVGGFRVGTRTSDQVTPFVLRLGQRGLTVAGGDLFGNTVNQDFAPLMQRARQALFPERGTSASTAAIAVIVSQSRRQRPPSFNWRNAAMALTGATHHLWWAVQSELGQWREHPGEQTAQHAFGWLLSWWSGRMFGDPNALARNTGRAARLQNMVLRQGPVLVYRLLRETEWLSSILEQAGYARTEDEIDLVSQQVAHRIVQEGLGLLLIGAGLAGRRLVRAVRAPRSSTTAADPEPLRETPSGQGPVSVPRAAWRTPSSVPSVARSSTEQMPAPPAVAPARARPRMDAGPAPQPALRVRRATSAARGWSIPWPYRYARNTVALLAGLMQGTARSSAALAGEQNPRPVVESVAPATFGTRILTPAVRGGSRFHGGQVISPVTTAARPSFRTTSLQAAPMTLRAQTTAEAAPSVVAGPARAIAGGRPIVISTTPGAALPGVRRPFSTTSTPLGSDVEPGAVSSGTTVSAAPGAAAVASTIVLPAAGPRRLNVQFTPRVVVPVDFGRRQEQPTPPGTEPVSQTVPRVMGSDVRVTTSASTSSSPRQPGLILIQPAAPASTLGQPITAATGPDAPDSATPPTTTVVAPATVAPSSPAAPATMPAGSPTTAAMTAASPMSTTASPSASVQPPQAQAQPQPMVDSQGWVQLLDRRVHILEIATFLHTLGQDLIAEDSLNRYQSMVSQYRSQIGQNQTLQRIHISDAADLLAAVRLNYEDTNLYRNRIPVYTGRGRNPSRSSRRTWQIIFDQFGSVWETRSSFQSSGSPGGLYERVRFYDEGSSRPGDQWSEGDYEGLATRAAQLGTSAAQILREMAQGQRPPSGLPARDVALLRSLVVLLLIRESSRNVANVVLAPMTLDLIESNASSFARAFGDTAWRSAGNLPQYPMARLEAPGASRLLERLTGLSSRFGQARPPRLVYAREALAGRGAGSPDLGRASDAMALAQAEQYIRWIQNRTGRSVSTINAADFVDLGTEWVRAWYLRPSRAR
jgi:hypothetical protein